ncbi:hydrogenase expression protein HypA [Streptomyces sp. NPDC060322]|uniref:hydrogenase expression protein HypA n=1 Tax=Streptomyces sp. NPDC060322 TaxID=3347097 RepID=UPI0036554781
MARQHDPSRRIPPGPDTSSGASDASGSSPAPARPAVPAQGVAGEAGSPGGSGDSGDSGEILRPDGLRGGTDTTETSSTAADPDSGPQAPTSESPEGGDAENEAHEGAGARTPSAKREGVAGTAATASGTAAARGIDDPDTSAEKVPEPASANSEETTTASASTASASGPAAARATTGTVGRSPGVAVAVAVADSGRAGTGTRTDGELLGSRPKKPILAAAAVIGAILVSVPFLVMGQDDRKPDKDRTQNAAGTVLGTERSEQPETYTAKSPSPSATPSKEKEKAKEKPSAPPAAKPVVVPPPVTPERKPTATVTAKAPPNTAASALSGLAKSDPEGRHICYRAFVSGSGWQTPVCDGTMAGTAGQGKQITALNIAVWNVGGSSANALLHDQGATSGNAKWAPNWTATVADGKNNYIGSAQQGAPFLTGFAMNVGKGSVCHTARLDGGGWGPQYCKNSRPEYMFVGTVDNKRWFEAVKLTV